MSDTYYCILLAYSIIAWRHHNILCHYIVLEVWKLSRLISILKFLTLKHLIHQKGLLGLGWSFICLIETLWLHFKSFFIDSYKGESELFNMFALH